MLFSHIIYKGKGIRMGFVRLMALLRHFSPTVVGRKESVSLCGCVNYFGHAKTIGQRECLLINGLSADDKHLLVRGTMT